MAIKINGTDIVNNSRAIVNSTGYNGYTPAPTSRTITTGTGILGGGNLTANRTFSIDIASQAEAQAGTDNAHVMTPLRVKQSVVANGYTDARARAAQAGHGAGGVGSYAAMKEENGTHRATGNLVAGSSLQYISFSGLNSNAFATGTWRLMGAKNDVNNSAGRASLWLRVS